MRAEINQQGLSRPATNELERTLTEIYAACEELKLGVSVVELTTKLSSNEYAKRLLNGPGGFGYVQLLDQLEADRWLETEGRISLEHLKRLACAPSIYGTLSEEDMMLVA